MALGTLPATTSSGAKDHISIQRNMAEVDEVTSRFNANLKPKLSVGPFSRGASQMTSFFNCLRPTASLLTGEGHGCGIFAIHK